MIIYLDFDGVLHHENVVWIHGKGIQMAEPGHALFEWEPILVELLEPYPAVKIVLSTSWVRVKSFSYASGRLSPALRNRIIGSTFHSRLMDRNEFSRLARGAQIVADATRRQASEWLALDDDGEDWPTGHQTRLVHTNEALGISDIQAQKKVHAWLIKNC